MANIKLRIVFFILTAAAFFGPFGAVIAHERNKQIEKLALERKEYLAAQLDTEQARLEYLKAIDGKRAEMLAYMASEKQRYEALLASQKTEVANHQRVATRTVTKNVVQTQTVAATTKSTGSSTASTKPTTAVKVSAPKAATKTKTS
ncbi:MAG: hypothetical protein ACEQSB_05010 [Undibacterium sp.]